MQTVGEMVNHSIPVSPRNGGKAPREANTMRMLRTGIRTIAKGKVTPPVKGTDAHYLKREHKAWSEAVIGRAQRRCQGMRNGKRCGATTPRMYADHIIELQDGGAPYDVANGQCLCPSCHTTKTIEARRKRASMR